MEELVFKGPLNSLSFGNVSVNFLRALKGLGKKISLFPIGEKGDLSAFDKLDEDLKKWIQNSVHSRYKTVSSSSPTLQMWHINGSENRITPDQTLFTFYELDSPTETEVNLVNLQNKVIFSSASAADHFKSKGCTNVYHSPLGFDPDFYKTDKKYLENKIHFGLMGKWEKRKHTQKIIDLWAKEYGNNYKYQLSCCVTNPFIKKEEMKKLMLSASDDGKIGNINFLPFLPQNTQVNEYLNAIDIDLSGLSGAEGWNLPAFNATCLGKWSIVLNCSAHKDWANTSNAILVDPSGKEPAADGIFFNEKGDFNIGNKYLFDDDDVTSAMKAAEARVGEENSEGILLQEKFSYKKSIERILEIMAK